MRSSKVKCCCKFCRDVALIVSGLELHTATHQTTLSTSPRSANPLYSCIRTTYSTTDTLRSLLTHKHMRMLTSASTFSCDASVLGLAYSSAHCIISAQDFGCSRDDFNCQCPTPVNTSNEQPAVTPPLPVCPGQAASPTALPAAAPSLVAAPARASGPGAPLNLSMWQHDGARYSSYRWFCRCSINVIRRS
jgi:hypothetical protein